LSSADGPPDLPAASTAAADAASAAESEPEPVDELRAGLVSTLEAELGDGVVATHLRPGDDVWVRVRTEAWKAAGEAALAKLGCRYFGFLSAIDWLPSPFGRYEDAEVDTPFADRLGNASDPAPGYTGADTRVQVFARVVDIERHVGLTLKADVPDDTMRIDSWVSIYRGADWHEREAWEMYGIDFVGHPGLRHIYLPGDFEGHPLKKDFPLLARVVKPWPGIVDVEPMPGEPDEPTEGEVEAAAAEGECG
jgi:NADH-quinone oxidoreductase subunit C